MDFLSSIDQAWPGGIRAISAALSAVCGAWVAAAWKQINHRVLCVLISFAAGALLAVAVLDLLREAFEIAGWAPAVLSAAVGYGFFFILSRFVSHVCPACSATHTEIHFRSVTGPLVAALAVHSFIDGLALYGHAHGHTHGHAHFAVPLAVVLHKFPEGLALTLVARSSGYGRWHAFGLAAFVEVVTTFLGAWAGSGLLAEADPALTAALMGFVGGTFVFLVFHALLSEIFKHHPRTTLLSAVLGAAMIVASGFWGGH